MPSLLSSTRGVFAGIARFSLVAGLTAVAAGEVTSLFDGKSLDGWDYDPKIWRVEDGAITGGSLPS